MDKQRVAPVETTHTPSPGPEQAAPETDTPAAAFVAQQPGAPPLEASRVLSLQHTLGNTHVQRMLSRQGAQRAIQRSGVLQRVQINFADAGETLYNSESATTNNFTPQSYGGGSPIKYQMTRNDPSKSVQINVRIKFVSRAPAANGSRDGADTALPASDPRRGFATTMCSQLVGAWNNKFALVGKPKPDASASSAGATAPAATPAAAPAATPAAPTPAPASGATPAAGPPPAPTTAPADPNQIKLQMVFAATPEFDITSTNFDAVVAVYGGQTQAGGNHAIDAGHWYMNQGRYPAPAASIYAHEYGHLMGLQDEYSRSNHQMHRLMHRFSPNQATQNNQALDQATVSRMVLQAIAPTLQGQITAQGAQIAAMFSGQGEKLTPQLSAALRTSLRSQTTVDALLAQIDAQFQTPQNANAQSAMPKAAYFELFDNFSNVQIARDAVTQALRPDGIANIIMAVLGQVVRTKSVVSIPNPQAGGDAMNLEVEASSNTTSQASLAGASQTLATNMMGAPTAGAAGTPPIYPSGTIMSELQSLASTWKASGASFGSVIDEGKIRTQFLQAATAAIYANPVSGASGAGGVYQALLRIVTASARAAANRSLRELFGQAIRPTLEAQATQLLSWVEEETKRHTTATGTGTNANPNAPADPAIMGAVQQMETQMRQTLQNAQTAPATASEEPATGSTDQPVSYSVQGLMGNNVAGSGVRADMMAGTDTMAGVATQFNQNLKLPTEEDFKAQGV